ncbi:MAG: hypothetical protein K0S23_825 [Fluviicola sp.]|nr:hypothetical protein [Fluviicola sp.]
MFLFSTDALIESSLTSLTSKYLNATGRSAKNLCISEKKTGSGLHDAYISDLVIFMSHFTDMKNLFTVLFCLLSLFSEAQKKHSFNEAQFYSELGTLAEKKDFFQVKKLLVTNKSRIDQEVYYYYWSLAENAFSHFSASNEAIELFLEGAGSMKNDSVFKEILLVKQLNLVNLFEYKDAYLTNQYILEHFKHVCTEEEIEDLTNTGKIWKALENSGKQKIHHPVDVKIGLTRDMAKLANVPVTVSGKTKNFIFDTGANFSVIQRSVALEMNCEIIPVQFDVSAITGAKVKSDLAVVKELFIGDQNSGQVVRCENVVFLVFDDKDLTFSEVNYSIQGIIGFPVIRNLDEIRITKEDELLIPKTPEVYQQSNMILNGFVPVVQVIQEKDTLQFSFDTGAVETSLNRAYYQKYKKRVEKKGKKKTLKSGGAGGMVEFEGYLLPSVTLAVGTSEEVTLKDIQVRKDQVGEVSADFDGNLGQDFIKQFDEMIISFKYSAIQFR